MNESTAETDPITMLFLSSVCERPSLPLFLHLDLQIYVMLALMQKLCVYRKSIVI